MRDLRRMLKQVLKLVSHLEFLINWLPNGVNLNKNFGLMWVKLLKLLLQKLCLRNSAFRVLVLAVTLVDANCVNNFDCCNSVSLS